MGVVYIPREPPGNRATDEATKKAAIELGQHPTIVDVAAMQIQEVINTINQMQADGVIERYAIGGAVGATFYLEPVATLDVDVFIEFRAEPGSHLVSLE